jgi:hypothetical protein
VADSGSPRARADGIHRCHAGWKRKRWFNGLLRGLELDDNIGARDGEPRWHSLWTPETRHLALDSF